MSGRIKKAKDLKFVSTNISVSFLRPFSNLENGLRKETEILVEANFRSFAFFIFLFFLFDHSKILLLVILFANVWLYKFLIIHQLSLAKGAYLIVSFHDLKFSLLAVIENVLILNKYFLI